MHQVLVWFARARSVFPRGALGWFILILAGPACNSSARTVPIEHAQELRLGVTQGTSGGDPSSGAPAAAGLLNEEGLTGVGQDGRALPRIAHSFSSSPDGLQWTFKLRPNVRYHDGSDLKAEDVKEYVRRLHDAGRESLQDIQDVTLTASNDLVIRLRRPSALLPEDFSSAFTKRVNGITLATGPFRTVAQTPNQIVLERNDKYYGKVPDLARITVRAYPNFRQAYAELLRGEIDGVYDVGQEPVEFLRNESSIQLYPFKRPFITVMLLNNGLPKFRDSRVRQALNLAVDRREVVEVALQSRGEEAGTAVRPGHWAFDERRSGFAFDPQRALALLDAAGVRGQPRLKFTCLVPDVFETWKVVALVVQRQLAELGVEVTLESVTYSEFIRRNQSGQFEAALMEMMQGPGMNILSRFWRSPESGGQWNTWNYRSAEADRAFDALRASVDSDSYRRGVSLVQQAMNDDPPAVFVVWREVTRALNRRFQVNVAPGHDVRETIGTWTVTGQPPFRRAH